MSNVNVANLTGLNGGEVITGPRAVTGKQFQAIFCVDAVTINTIQTNIDQSTDTLAGVVFPAGSTLFGLTTQLDLTLGTVIAYNKA
jgi:hypothetical protein